MKYFIRHIKNKTTKYFTHTKNVCSSITGDYTQFRLDEIDTKTGNTIIYCHGTRTIIKTTLLEILNDHRMVAALSSIQACWLGYYYGKLCGKMDMDKKQIFAQQKCNGFLLYSTKGKFKITSLDRHNNVTYIDIKSRKEYTENLLTLAYHERLIAQFDPSQACYIGLMAGIIAEKNDNFGIRPKIKPILEIIK